MCACIHCGHKLVVMTDIVMVASTWHHTYKNQFNYPDTTAVGKHFALPASCLPQLLLGNLQ